MNLTQEVKKQNTLIRAKVALLMFKKKIKQKDLIEQTKLRQDDFSQWFNGKRDFSEAKLNLITQWYENNI